ncbi:MAG: hypothetical protein QM784_29570 [Polyangiaceae bacterium]
MNSPSVVSSTAARLVTWSGGMLWTCAYGFAFITGLQTRSPAFPVPAILLNLTWEFAFAVLSPPKGRGTRAVYLSWFATDGLLWLQLFWLGPPQELAWIPRSIYPLGVLLGTGVAFALHRLLNRFLNAPHLQAYLTNVVTSGAFLWILLARDDCAALTTPIAWLKFLGTSLITLANLQHFWRRQSCPPLAILFMVGVTILDATYIALLYVR